MPEDGRVAPGGLVAEDLDRLPDLPARTELVDGRLVFAGPQSSFRSTVVDLLVAGLRRAVPLEFRVRRGMSVILGARQRPQPDVSVVRAGAVRDDGGEPVVRVYERDPTTRAYALTGIHHHRLKLTVPFHLDVDLSRIHHL
ncbi:Uma2 family endonuclease [Nonomuraea sp. NPDC049758]|uniref:Uma2 family endonuclease n=1 Tax=Nonomuraea sp. NPDC049758 TaxID=3154360 RepID=UPI003416C670